MNAHNFEVTTSSTSETSQNGWPLVNLSVNTLLECRTQGLNFKIPLTYLPKTLGLMHKNPKGNHI